MAFPAFRLTNFPEPVRENRFLAPLCVFIFLFFMIGDSFG